MTVNSNESAFIDELLRERELSVDDYWALVESTMDNPVGEWFNAAHESVDRWATDPEKPALTIYHSDLQADNWTYADLKKTSSQLADAYRSRGLEQGDRVAVLLTRQIEAYLCALGSWRSGLIHMPMFVGLGSAAIAVRVNSAQPKVVVLNASTYTSWIADVEPRLSSKPEVWVVGEIPAADLRERDREFWAELREQPEDFETVRTQLSDPATLLYTSGTTGPPKGCVMPHSLIMGNRPFVRHCFGLRENDIMFSGADPGWAYGLYTIGFSVMSTGQALIIYTGNFDPEAWLKIWELESVTFVAAAPSALRKVVSTAQKVGFPSTITRATSAGEPLDGPLVEAWRKLCPGDIRDGYGQSESAMMLANLEAGPPIVAGSLSSVVPGNEVTLLNDDGSPAGDQGVIAIRRPRYQGSIAYWNEPQKWEARWRGDWFLTGDVARRDEEDRWWFVGRDDDLIITSGYNVGPTEVENVLLAHPRILDAAAVSSPDPKRGKVVRAVLVADSDENLDELTAELQAQVKAQVGRHAYPRIIDYVAELPRTESGKLRRNVLRG